MMPAPAPIHHSLRQPESTGYLIAARSDSRDSAALIGDRGEAAFAQSMVLGRHETHETIRVRRADGTSYPALPTGLQ